MSGLWNLWVWVLTITTLVFVSWLLYSNYRDGVSDKDHHRRHETHDGIGESFSPIPFWWAALMAATIVFAVFYLALFPGLGNYKGLLNWTAVSSMDAAEEKFGTRTKAVLRQHRSVPVDQLTNDTAAMLLGARLFRNNCAGCHGMTGKGNKYFPDLGDSDWLFGANEEAIRTSISDGRTGVMPAWGKVLSNDQLIAVADYVLDLGMQEDKTPANQAGQTVFAQFCAACHGATGVGNTALGAPSLINGIWLYGGTPAEIRASIRLGRSGEMPSHNDRLSGDEIHLLTAFVLHLRDTQ